jgi:hypothetical protein
MEARRRIRVPALKLATAVRPEDSHFDICAIKIASAAYVYINISFATAPHWKYRRLTNNIIMTISGNFAWSLSRNIAILKLCLWMDQLSSCLTELQKPHTSFVVFTCRRDVSIRPKIYYWGVCKVQGHLEPTARCSACSSSPRVPERCATVGGTETWARNKLICPQ